jgi:hypothetical protein
MNFQHQAHEEIYKKVGAYLKEVFGEMVHTRADHPSYVVPMGSTFANVNVYPWGETDATVNVRAWVVMGAEMTPELMHYLLRQNDDFRFGGFGLDKENDIFFEHTIVGSTLDKEELKASVLAVVGTADRYDDEIQRKWGGRKAMDKS